MYVKILVVDDDPSVLRTLSFFLRASGFAVQTCSDPQEALELVLGRGFHIVVLDISMPQMDGVALLKKIKEFDPFIQVIMVSAYATVDRCVRCLELGANDFVEKPFEDLAKLREVIENTTRKLERWQGVLGHLQGAAF